MRATLVLLSLLSAAPAGAGRSALPSCGRCLPIVPVNIVGALPDGTPDDRRGTLGAMAGPLGLTPVEAARLAASTGIVLCDTGQGMRPLASAVLVGDASTIATAAHVLRDPSQDGAPLPPGTACQFRSQGQPQETVALRLDATEVLGAGGRADIWDPNDFAVVRLAAPLQSIQARPFPIVSPPVDPGAAVILVSGFQVDLRDRLGERQPIVQLAHVEQAGSAAPGEPRPIYLAGAMDAGGSGGAMLVRTAGGLALAGIVSTTGAVNRNGFAFSLPMMSFIRVIAVEGDFRRAVEGPTRLSRAGSCAARVSRVC